MQLDDTTMILAEVSLMTEVLQMILSLTLSQVLFIPCAVCALVSVSKGLGIRDDRLIPSQIMEASMVSLVQSLAKALT